MSFSVSFPSQNQPPRPPRPFPPQSQTPRPSRPTSQGNNRNSGCNCLPASECPSGFGQVSVLKNMYYVLLYYVTFLSKLGLWF